MANFQIYLLTPRIEDYHVKFLKNLMCDYTSQTARLNSNLSSLGNYQYQESFCYTFAESFQISQHAKKTLTFSMMQKIFLHNEWIDNPFVESVKNGNIVLLVDKYNNHHIMTVKNIEYADINEINSTITYTCVDFFSYQTTRQNDGYTISNDSSSDDYIGAKDVDWWISQKIVPECYISYTYLKLADSLVLNSEGELVINPQKATINKIIKRAYPKTNYTDYYETLAYSVSSSNANNALVTLAEQLDLMIGTAERLNEDGTLTRYFWLEPMKKEEVSGLTYSPYDNLSDFSFSHNGESLATVLNVDSVTVGDDIITLIPNVPAFFIDYFNSQEWANAEYSPNMFSRVCQYQEYECQIENGSTYTLSGITFSNSYSFITLDFNESYAMIQGGEDASGVQLNLSSSYLQFEIITTDEEVQQTTRLFLNNEIPQSFRGHTVDIVIGGYDFTQAKLMVCIARNPTQEELQFAKIADNCPWLENKIIDFTYFVENGLMSKQDYNVLMDIMRNKLRYVNSQLLVATQDYTRALHTRTEIISRITNDLDELGAMYSSNIMKSYETNSCFTDVNDFVNKCESILEAPRNIELFLRSDLITQYVNNYTNAQQRFLKNIYAFCKYFEEQFTGSGLANPTIYNNILTLDTSVDYGVAGTYYIAEIANQTPISITNDLVQKALSDTLDDWYYYNVFDANGVNKMIVTTSNFGKFVKLMPTSYSAVDPNSRYDDTITYYLKDEKDNYKAATKNDLLWAYKGKTQETNPILTQNWGYLTTKTKEIPLWKDKQTQGNSFYSEDRQFWYDWQGFSIVVTYGNDNKKLTIPVATVESYNKYYAINSRTFTPELVGSLADKVLFNNITSIDLSDSGAKTVQEWLTLTSDDSIKNVIFTSQASMFIEPWTKWFDDIEGNINKIKQLVLTLGQVDYLVNTLLPDNADTKINSIVYTSSSLRPALTSEINNNTGLPKDVSSYVTVLYSKKNGGAEETVYNYNDSITTLNWKIFGTSDVVVNFTQTISWIGRLFSPSDMIDHNGITIGNIQDVGSLVTGDLRFIYLIKDTPYWTAWKESSSDTIIDKDSREEVSIPSDLCQVLNADPKNPILFTLDNPNYTTLEKSDVVADKEYRTDIIYYYENAGEHIQVYNLLQAKNAGFSIYNRSQLSETTLGATKNNWSVALDLMQIVVSGGGQVTRTVVDTITENLTWTASDVPNSQAKYFARRSIKGADGKYYQLAYNCSSSELQRLDKMSNGNVWYRYHALNVEPSNPKGIDATLQQYAALIETTLSTYWDSAYTASINTDFVLPQYWQKSVDAEDNNNFFNNLFSTTDNSISIAENGLIPEVKLLSDSKANTEFTFYRFVFGAENLDNTLEVVDAASINNAALQNALKRLPTDIYSHLYAQPYSEEFNTTYYYTEKHPLTHLEFITKYSTDVINVPYYSGWYLNMLYILDKYKEQTVWNYQHWLDQHNMIWQSLYNNYPNVILENKYTPEDASNSWEVYVLAKNAFKDLSYPEKDYSLKVINSTQLLMMDASGSNWVKYADKELTIGEAIAINSNDLDKNFDEVKRSLQQYLFITDISYTLRNDTDVQLTVNIIKYQDKIIRRLVNLIK